MLLDNLKIRLEMYEKSIRRELSHRPQLEQLGSLEAKGRGIFQEVDMGA